MVYIFNKPGKGEEYLINFVKSEQVERITYSYESLDERLQHTIYMKEKGYSEVNFKHEGSGYKQKTYITYERKCQ